MVLTTSSGLPKPKVFCGRCACVIYTLPPKAPIKMAALRTALIDGYQEAYKPREEWFIKSRMPWSQPLEGAKQHQADGKLWFKLSEADQPKLKL